MRSLLCAFVSKMVTTWLGLHRGDARYYTYDAHLLHRGEFLSHFFLSLQQRMQAKEGSAGGVVFPF